MQECVKLIQSYTIMKYFGTYHNQFKATLYHFKHGYIQKDTDRHEYLYTHFEQLPQMVQD